MSEITPSEFYLNTPLYTQINFNKSEDIDSYVRVYRINSFEGYNPNRGIETTFSVNGESISDYSKPLFMEISLICKRSSDKFYFYVAWEPTKKTLMKIGQFPTVADFHRDSIKQYDKLLNKEKLREFTKAIGLAANGVGIGSFVYLRRIFEDLIYEALADYVKNHQEIESFNKMRMAEKIEALKEHLPEFLVENKELYGILSKGIHELDEKDCLVHFEAVKVGIEMILDEKLEQLNKKKKAEAARQRIQQAASAIRKPADKP